MIRRFIKKILAPIVREIMGETIQEALKASLLTVDKFEIVSKSQKPDSDNPD